MTPEPISVEELFAAIADASIPREQNAGYTVREMAEASGHDTDTVRKRLRAAIKAGQVRVSRKRLPNMAGVWQTLPSYLLLPPP